MCTYNWLYLHTGLHCVIRKPDSLDIKFKNLSSPSTNQSDIDVTKKTDKYSEIKNQKRSAHWGDRTPDHQIKSLALYLLIIIINHPLVHPIIFLLSTF